MSLFYTNETNTLKNHKEKVGDIMTSLKSINRRVGSLFAVAALVLATITPGLVPSFASAAQLTERSVELSSSSRQATGVDYTLDFTAVGAFRAVVLDFCNDTPLIGAACTGPSGFSVSSASLSSASTSAGYSLYTTGAADDANTLVLSNSGEIAAGARSIELTNVTNPSNAGALYIRIVTYTGEDTATAASNAGAYVSNAAPGTGSVDQGSAAASITETVGVSGAVLETMTFCVAGNEIDDDGCTRQTGQLTAPTLRLGETVGTTSALSVEDVSEGSIYSQLSTNAAGGAVVSLKSSNTCGGLKRLDASDCDIAAANGAGGIAAGEAKFGVRVVAGSDPNTGTNSFGTFQIAGTGGTPYYSDSVFKLNYVSNASSGVTSPFGDPILDTADGPVSNKNAQITFGASISGNTPAGLYSTDLSLIATGKF